MTMDKEEKDRRIREGIKATTAVRIYLEALEAVRPRRGGSHKTLDEMNVDLAQLRARIEKADPMKKLALLPKHDKLLALVREREEEAQAKEQLDVLAEDFIQYAAAFGEHRGVTYEHWLEVLVPPEILAKAGIERQR